MSVIDRVTPHRRLSGLSKAMVTLLIVNAALYARTALSAWSITTETIGWDDLSPAQRQAAAAQAADTEASIAAAWDMHAMVLLALGVLFIVWAWRATKNLQRFGETPKRKPGWAIGGWFIPIGNLWIPYQTIRDAWTKLPESVKGDRPTGLVWLWAWVLWIGAGVSAAALARYHPETGVEVGRYYLADGLLSLVAGASCVLAAVAVPSISAAQDRAA